MFNFFKKKKVEENNIEIQEKPKSSFEFLKNALSKTSNSIIANVLSSAKNENWFIGWNRWKNKKWKH